MPKKAMNYNNTIIYKIVCKELSIKDCYVGHTTNFISRKCDHKNNCSNENSSKYTYPVYKFIRENGGWNNWDMIEIEKVTCNDRNEASKKERHWIKELAATLNKQIPTRTTKEYYEVNKNAMELYKTQWKNDNKDKVKLYAKSYREQNKVKVLIRNKAYYDKNQAKLLAKCECICGGKYVHTNKARHLQTKKHLKYFEQIL
jgi:hypothetical protein